MSNTIAGVDFTKDFLSHFGRKGMKWGVRNVEKKTAKAEASWQKKAASPQEFVRMHNAAADRMNNGEIKKFNNRPQFKGKDVMKPGKLHDRYLKEYSDLFVGAMNSEAKKLGVSPAGNRLQFKDAGGSLTAYLVSANAKHADDEDLTLTFERDELGHILSTRVSDGPLVQGALSAEAFIEHYGVKGMRWGRSSKRGTSGSSKAKAKDDDDDVSEDAARAKQLGSKAKSSGTKALSNQELRQLVDRMSLEKRYKDVITPEAKKKNPILVGTAWTAKKLGTMTGQAAEQVFKANLANEMNVRLKAQLAAKPKASPQLKMFDYS